MEHKRLNKYLVEAGVCSRREADRLLSLRKILVNGRVAQLGEKVDGSEKIEVNGKIVSSKKPKSIYLAYHKPIGVICTADLKAKDNIIQAVNYPERVFTIGRLDVASSGLILLTNDGEAAYQMTQASGGHEKEYVVGVDRQVTPDFLKRMTEGVEVLGRKTLPAKVRKLREKTFTLVLVEGRNRQIRRMCEALGFSVKSLKRVRVMNVELGDLPLGKWRKLTLQEEKNLANLLALEHNLYYNSS